MINLSFLLINHRN